jgi:hypothetical protein
MPDTSWATEPATTLAAATTTTPSTTTTSKTKKTPSKKKMAGATVGAHTKAEMDEVADRTALIADKLKTLYTKSVYPVEKRYQYDYFFESPFMTDVEFDGACGGGVYGSTPCFTP